MTGPCCTQPFWKVTLRLQGQAADGSYGAIWEVLPCMYYLMDGLRGASNIHTYRKAKHFHVCINNALVKLEEYSKILNDSPPYAASVVANPEIKESYFDRHGRGADQKEDIRDFWEAESEIVLEETPESEADEIDDSLNDFICHQGDTSDAQDEYSRYCNEPILSKAPPHLLLYWNAQVINTPSLAQISFNPGYV
jgi:hypothetical protein